MYSKGSLQHRDALLSAETPTIVFTSFQVIIMLLQNHLKSNAPPKLCIKKSKHWFDHKCIAMKKSLTEQYQLYREQNRPTLPPEWFTLKKSYKDLIKTKKMQDTRNTWQTLINAAREKDSATSFGEWFRVLGQKQQ